MPKDVELQIDATSFYAAKRAVEKLTNRSYYRGEIKNMITSMLEMARMYASEITHVWTGSLKKAHRVEYDSHSMRGRLYVDPAATSPRTTTRVAVYAMYEHAEGGSHAFYERTYNEMHSIWAITGVRIALKEFSRI